MLDEIDKTIISELQGGFPVSERPFADTAKAIGIHEEALIERLKALLANGVLTRFGPMFNAERIGGAFCLCAMSVDAESLANVIPQINARPEVAHNYERQHMFNIWFVLATEKPEQIDTAIEKLDEYFIGLKVDI
jgi:DNA-binding Lrp family transcriptional regulator